MTNPIRATRDNLLPGTIWQNAAGTSVCRVQSSGEIFIGVEYMNSNHSSSTTSAKSEFIKSDIWYKVQPIKEAGE